MSSVVSASCGHADLERFILDCVHAAVRERLLKLSGDFERHADTYAVLRDAASTEGEQKHLDGKIEAYRFASLATFDRTVKP